MAVQREPSSCAERVGVAVVGRELAAVVAVDARQRQLEGGHRLVVARHDSGCDLGRGHANACRGEVEPVEAARQLDERRVAVLAHVRDDGAHGLVDVLGGLALGREKGRERALEVGVGGGQVHGHGLARPAAATAPPSCVSRLRRIVVGMSRHGFGAPHRPQVLHLGLDALHLEADRCSVGEVERHVTAGVFRRLADSKAMVSSDRTASFFFGSMPCSLAPNTRSKRNAICRRT